MVLDDFQDLLEYDRNTGVFRWLKGRGSVKAGQPAGSKQTRGYIQIKVNKKFYLAHRLAWLFETGQWPKDEIDHINGVHADNRIENLREATRCQNMANVGVTRQNVSGLKGAYWHKPTGKWHSRISVSGKRKHLGYFKSKESAAEAYKKAAKAAFGEYAV
jgi:hypothetical protein